MIFPDRPWTKTHHSRSEVDQLRAGLCRRETGYDDEKDGDEIEHDEHDHAVDKGAVHDNANVGRLEQLQWDHGIGRTQAARAWSRRDLFCLKEVLPKHEQDNGNATNDETSDDLRGVPLLVGAPVECKE